MRIQPTGSFGFDPNRNSLSIRAQRAAPSSSRRRPHPAADLARRLIDLREQLDGLRDASGTRRTSSGVTGPTSTPATAVSASALEVSLKGSPTTLSTSGLVASPTSLVELTKSFSGASTSQAIFDGTYDGSLGDQVELSFRVKRGGVLGEDDTEIEVFDDQGTRIDTLKIDKKQPDEVFALSVGPEVRFTSGELLKEDTFSLDLSTSNGVIDPDQPLQGSGLPGSVNYSSAFDEGSTAIATVGGTYTGALDDTLRFEVDRAGIVGLNDVELGVFDGVGDKIGTLKFDKELASGTELSLSNGLTVALSSGALLKDDQFEVSVKADDQVVFGDGLEVQAGTFSINDTAIVVDRQDTIRTLADKITASDAGVSASFDASSGEFLLTRKENGADVIDLGADDTGFFAAIGLEESQQVPGTEAGGGVIELSELEGLTSGTFFINGESVTVDVAKDTVDDVLARIHSLEADVQATYEGNRLHLSSNETFELQNGSSAFFDAFEIDTGLYEPTELAGRVEEEGVQDSSRLRQYLSGFERSLNRIFTLRSDARLPDFTGTLMEAIRGSFDIDDDANPYSLNTRLGLRFQLQDTTDVLTIDSSILDRTLSTNSHELRDFLSGRAADDDPGLVESLSTALDQLLEQLVHQLDPLRDGGLLIDIQA